MLMADILHSCTDEGIAAAAVASIGGPFAAAIRLEAEHRGLSVGALTASLVAAFARNASERDWRELSVNIAGADLPVLFGLQAMAERSLRQRDQATRARPVRDGRTAATGALAGPALLFGPG
ncbi:hypothetical protein D3272_11365 [Lichenibacterium ramalinae]|uniref:Uncharacterized protein n=2 Tax=Lichenibacterium ramalinae TaxID=2316527 RepID=A0A4Q2RFD1_9HYPH|nr:hypothetical protein D3272_11365 [Lichenibacterium ramalinae]